MLKFHFLNAISGNYALPLLHQHNKTHNEMKLKNILSIATAVLMTMSAPQAVAKVIYTGEIGKKVMGYNGTTPLNITIENGKITKIEALDNTEGPKYMKRAQAKVFPQFIGKSVKQAIKVDADVATGATYTSKALIQNIQLGLKKANGTLTKKKRK